MKSEDKQELSIKSRRVEVPLSNCSTSMTEGNIKLSSSCHVGVHVMREKELQRDKMRNKIDFNEA
jgi:hypothetical protein